jgi:hypothetical protein
MSKQAEETEQYNFPGPGEYKILHGEAPDYIPRKSIRLMGVLGAPLAFLAGRGEVDQQHAHMTVDNDKGQLVLTVDDEHPETTHVITGSLSPDANLALFGINTEKRWGVKAFAKFIRTMRYYFADQNQVGQLIADLQKFEGTVTKIFKDHNDPTGDSLYHLEQKVDGVKMERRFKLKVPIFKGYADQTFTVEICYDTKSTTVDLFLISDELYMLEPQIRAELMSFELAKFAEYSFARVVVS